MAVFGAKRDCHLTSWQRPRQDPLHGRMQHILVQDNQLLVQSARGTFTRINILPSRPRRRTFADNVERHTTGSSRHASKKCTALNAADRQTRRAHIGRRHGHRIGRIIEVCRQRVVVENLPLSYSTVLI